MEFINTYRKQVALLFFIVLSFGAVLFIRVINSDSKADNFPKGSYSDVEARVDKYAQSIINMSEIENNKMRFKSAIQSPNYHTDRDVGASGVGMAFILMAKQYPDNSIWTESAEQTAAWLLSVAKQDSNGYMHWTDFSNNDEDSAQAFTSFDDGTIGIGDFFWHLYELTGKNEYRDVYISTLNWTIGAATTDPADPNTLYWRYDINDKQSDIFMGVGMGQSGIVLGFSECYQRLKEVDEVVADSCLTTLNKSLTFIENAHARLKESGYSEASLPEKAYLTDADIPTFNSGYLSGAAGSAYMYLKLYDVLGNEDYLKKAQAIFNWLENENNGLVVKDVAGSSWRISLEGTEVSDGGQATGFEEGAAGIGWVYLQAYKLTDNEHYLEIAKAAAAWLDAVAIKNDQGFHWNEVESPAKRVSHANLNNGNAGIGVFYQELYFLTDETLYQENALQVFNWVDATAKSNEGVVYWQDNDGESDYSYEPSWHWGNAGIVYFGLKLLNPALPFGGMQVGL